MINNKLSTAQAWLVLNALPHLGPVSLRRLLDAFANDPNRVLAASQKELMSVDGVGPVMADSIINWPKYFDLEAEIAKMEESGVEFISLGDIKYPELLKEIYDSPVGLYCNGRLPDSQLNVAIVGSRRSTVYGRGVARKLARDLASRGVCIVSGMARGIDTAAHQGALEAGGQTVAVLGCGLDIIYPPENLDLYRAICKSGAVISEFTLGRKADRQTFPMRNRIVSGMCHGLIVIESDNNGGSMITAKFACEHNRQLFAVPGRIDQAVSRGCHALIKDGAVLVTDYSDVLNELTHTSQAEFNYFEEHQPVEKVSRPSEADLNEFELNVYKHFQDGESCGVDQLVSNSGMTVSDISSALLILELKKFLVKRSDGTYEKAVN